MLLTDSERSLELFLLVAAALVIFSVLASKITSRFGVPALLLFLGIGMIAGSDGPGGIEFTNYPMAFAIGSVSLVFILFDGGLRTAWRSVRPVLTLGVLLSSLGVLITALATGCFARFVLGLPWTQGMLLGSIVSSTDAAAVFSILRAKHLRLKGNLKQVLEFEAGSNDPTAIFLTTVFLALSTSRLNAVSSIIPLFFLQAGFGLACGWLSGKGIKWLINHIGIEYEGLYSVLLFALVLLVFSATGLAGGSGFLAVYVTGLILGNAELLHRASILKFHDGIAWIAQISLFMALGLLVFPSHLGSVWQDGILFALFLMFVARPLSVFVSAIGSRFGRNERLFISWVGLRGAAPILLATLPWSMGIPNAEYYFNLVFFVVLISVTCQGMSIPWVAKKLGVVESSWIRAINTPSEMLPDGYITHEVELEKGSPAEGVRVVDLKLPDGTLLICIEREKRFLIPKGDTVLEAGDVVRSLVRPDDVEKLSELFQFTQDFQKVF